MIYKVNLKPLDYYFFGTSRKFVRSDSIKNESNPLKANYYIDSMKFPQQTSIIGAMRKQILKWNGIFNSNFDYNEDIKKSIRSLIGDKGFVLGDSSGYVCNDYGVLKSISPVFICKNDSNEVTVIDDSELTYKEPINKKYNIIQAYSNGFIKDGLEVLKMEYKKDPSTDNNEEDEKIGEIFSVKSFLNVKINREGNKTDDTELFRKDKYRLNNGYNFTFFIEIAELNKLENCIVYLGGDKSPFEMSIEEVVFTTVNDAVENMNFSIAVNNSLKNNVIHFLSDTYLEQEDFNVIYEYATSGRLSYNDFNCFSHSISKNFSYQERSKLIEKRRKLIKAGSYINLKDKESVDKIESIILGYKAFTQIGYNYILRGGKNV